MIRKGTVDREVLLKVKEGDYLAFQLVYNAYAQRLYVFVLKIVKDVDVADEVLQLTFVRLWKNRASIELDKLFDAYIFRISSNLAIDMLRQIAQNARKKEHLSQNNNEFSLSVEDSFLIKENQEKIAQLLTLLPPQRRQIFQMCKLEGYTYKEVAEELNISVSTVSNQLVAAVKKLREVLSKNKDMFILLLSVIMFYVMF